MAAYGTLRIETLTKDNFETWKIQMKALLIKNDSWCYVSGSKPKPILIEGDAKSKEEFDKWTEMDEKAKADIILCISPSELKQIKKCETSREIWKKLEEIYQSKGPARKASLLKSLIQHKMPDSSQGIVSIRDHLRKFFDIVDRLSEMDISIDDDLLTVMLLNSLPSSFENFRCAIESRDELPNPETLRIKIIEENDARQHDRQIGADFGAFIANHQRRKTTWNNKNKKHQKNEINTQKDNFNKTVCFRCKRSHRGYCDNYKEKSFNNKHNFSLFTNTDADHALSISEEKMKNLWCLDSGSTRHLCNNNLKFESLSECGIENVRLANDETIKVYGNGNAVIDAEINSKVETVKITDALLVPDLKTNLLSVSKICDQGYTVIFKNNCAIIKNIGKNITFIADRKHDLYYLRGSDTNNVNFVSESLDSSKNKFEDFEKWHSRMGHLNLKDLIESNAKGTIRGLNVTKPLDEFNCEVCTLNKLTRAPFPKNSERVTALLDIIYSDICGPIRIPSIGKSLYFITFIDGYSRYCVVKFLKAKNEALEAFKEVKNLWENQKSTKIKKFFSDNGGEYISNEFKNFLKENGIEHRLTAPYCPQQGGIAERKNRTLIEMARCLLSQSNLPLNLWAEAVNTANYIRNRCPTKILNGKTPYELWNNIVPNVSYFKIFGCTAYCLNNQPNHKFSPRSKKGIFVGYSDNSKAYRIYLPDENRVIISRSVKFFEEKRSNYSKIDHLQNEISSRDLTEPSETHRSEFREGEREIIVSPQITPESEKSEMSRDPAEEKNILSLRNREIVRLADTVYACNAEISIKNALNSPQAPEWYNAMINELKTILKNDTFEVVDRPVSQACVGSRFVFTNKYNQDGSLLKHKARLVARGFNQKYGIDFRETFAPVARMGTIRIMAALSAKLELKIHQFDVTSAYLNGKLDEEIFMECPDYFAKVLDLIKNDNSDRNMSRKATKILDSLNGGDKVLLLKKSLYGLKQAGRCWNNKLNVILNDFGAKQSSADPCLYYIKCEKGLTMILVYVDDILIMSQDPNKIEKFKNHLNKELDVKYVGLVSYCLGINFQTEKGIVAMSQQSYIRELLDRFNMTEAKPVACPMDINVKLQKADKCNEDEFPYRELVGSLMYLATSTRPDIANAVSQLSQFLNCFDNTHWTAAKRVLRYLKKTINYGLIFKQNNEPLFGYTDADWGNCPNDRKSYTGYCFLFSGSTITWESRKQCTVALSSTEAEYMALSDATKEAIYLSKLFNELCNNKIEKVPIFTDNKGSIQLAENPVFHKRTKHIDIRHHFVRDSLKNGLIEINFVPTDNMGADILTKSLPSEKHYKCLKMLGIEDLKLFIK